MNDDRAAFLNRFDVSRETSDKLEVYAELLGRWAERINLVSASTLPKLWRRHIWDSAQLLEIAPERWASWADLGSGAGFPGMVCAIMSAEKLQGAGFTLVEADHRKAAFLRTVARETGLILNIRAERIEETAPLNSDILSARALARLVELLGYAERHLSSGGRAIYLKGARARSEVDAALDSFRFDCKTYPSETDTAAVILSIGDIKRV